jgi:1-acyl-sn-glycerol-3-phosphate acyltransferase
MLRTILINLLIAVHTVLFCLYGIILALFDRTGRRIHFWVAVPWAKIILWFSGVNVRVRGLETLDTRVPRIYMSNHQSAFDIYALLANLPVDFKFILKQELMKIPLFGFAMKRAGYIGITREDPRKAIRSINDAAERIRSGSSVLIFPEGTRSADGRLQAFKNGGFHLALKSGCDIVPLAIVGSRHIVPKGSLKVNKGSFSIHIGKSIPLAGYTKKNLEELKTRVREAMAAALEGGKRT